MNKILTALGLASTFTLVSSRGDAGIATESASCSKQPDGSGTCSGTFLGFRNNADPNAYATFHNNQNWTGIVLGRAFSASLNGTYYSCTFTASQDELLQTAIASHGYFQIKWNTAGQCTDPYLKNGSQYANF